MTSPLHLVKLSVGTESPETLKAWHAMPQAQTEDGYPRHVTRMWPRRATELLGGGSIYWVIKGYISCRQPILRLDEVFGSDGIRRCAIVLDPNIVHVASTKKRPFQGWRYLAGIDAPIDITEARKGEDVLPIELSSALAEIGVF